MVRIGINGFGRIGRLALRAAWEQKLSLELVSRAKRGRCGWTESGLRSSGNAIGPS
ncbi:MAG: Glyceraldehyde 3-phosphate dehydrogenase, NAD binding domain [candidate division NC10 bacterium]|nr:Glyceraldehyde 3-phosphate dehydrogenase, NAD binding domain [candidate division NC10 bacterium]